MYTSLEFIAVQALERAGKKLGFLEDKMSSGSKEYIPWRGGQ